MPTKEGAKDSTSLSSTQAIVYGVQQSQNTTANHEVKILNNIQLVKAALRFGVYNGLTLNTEPIGYFMARRNPSLAEAKETHIEGSLDLLLHLKKLIQQTLDHDLKQQPIPEDLVSAYDQLVLLINNSISGLRLPASMTRTMLGDIRSTLMDYAVKNDAQHDGLINQLKALTNAYVSLAQAEQRFADLTSKYKQVGG